MCIDAVAAAVSMPFDHGLAFERKAFLELVATPESRALRHVFFAERAAGRIPGVPDGTPTRTIGTIGVIGAGTMGTGIAMNALAAGLPVVLLEMNRDALDTGVATIRRNYEASVGRGRLTRERLEQNMALLRPTLSYDDLGDVDLVIEAVFEEMDIKREVFVTLDRVAKAGAILATNTSTLDVDRIAAATSRPQDVIGMHFFSPANVMKLLEVVRGARTGADVLTTVMRFAKKIGKIAVVSGVCDGFIGNRMVEQYLRQAMFLLEEGASPRQVDAALEGFGMAMGPFRMSDLAGNDVGWRIRKRRYVEKPHVVYSRIADRLCEAGRFGQKAGMGWYRYESGRRDAIPDPAVDALIADYRAEIGVAPRAHRRGRDRRSLRPRAGERGRAHPGGGHRAARLGHRRRLRRRLRLSPLPRRSDVPRRPRGAARGAGQDAALRGGAARRRRVLAAGAAPAAARGGREIVQRIAGAATGHRAGAAFVSNPSVTT